MTLFLTPRGMPVTTSSQALAYATHAFEEEVLNYGNQAGALFDALPLDPDCGLATAYAAALHLFRSTREGHGQARNLIDIAVQMQTGTVRERSLISAISFWAAGDIARAIRCLKLWVASNPRDLFAVKLVQYLLFSTGQADAMLAAIKPVDVAVPDDARVLGMLAFAHDQTGDPAAAERAARAAIEIAPDPWAHHALAHAMDVGGRFDEGRLWMRQHADAWSNCTSFLYTHNWWHAALFHLALGDRDGALALYHERVWAVRKDYVQDQINAVSLLARLDLAGVDVGDRWVDVAHYVRPRRSDAIDGFLDLHYAYALARVGDDSAVTDLLNALRIAARNGSRVRRTALRAAEAIVAFARRDWITATQLLDTVAPELWRLGGSNVQRQLFADMRKSARAEGRSTLEFAA